MSNLTDGWIGSESRRAAIGSARIVGTTGVGVAEVRVAGCGVSRVRGNDQTRDGGRNVPRPLEEPASTDFEFVEILVFGIVFFGAQPGDTYPPVPDGNLTASVT